MRTLIIILVPLLLFACKSNPPKPVSPNAGEEYQARIREDKKRQAEQDLPFRGFKESSEIHSLLYACADSTAIWQSAGNHPADLMLLFGEQDRSVLKLSDYRNIREKLPFMSTRSSACGGSKFSQGEFIKSWPYIKYSIPAGRNGVYHSKIFGTKKNTVQIILLDTMESSPGMTENQWRWLENELKVPTTFKVIGGADSERLQELLKKSKLKNIIRVDESQLSPGSYGWIVFDWKLKTFTAEKF